jgi:hypothetical protein
MKGEEAMHMGDKDEQSVAVQMRTAEEPTPAPKILTLTTHQTLPRNLFMVDSFIDTIKPTDL